MRSITGIGETILDIVFKNDQPQAAVPGGSTFNAMISLGRTVGKAFPEIPIRMVTEVGDDHVGDMVVEFMRKNGVQADAATRNKGTQTAVSLAFLNSKNDAQYEFYKDHEHASLSDNKLSAVEFRKGDLVLFGSFFAINPVIRDSVLPLLQDAHDAGAVLYYDINFRRNHIGTLAQTMPSIEQNCRLSSVVRGSAEDFGFLYGTSDPEEVYKKYISGLCPNFICTCGAEPVQVFTPELHLRFDVPRVETVSTIGAGDNFNAGFLYGLVAEELGIDGSLSPSAAQWERIVHTAGKFSSNVCRSIYNYVDEGFSL